MRILVMSDMHGRKNNFEKAIEAQPTAKNVIFLGDGASAAESESGFFPDRKFHIVSGNCDFASSLPTVGILEINGVKILITHGHTYRVKYGTEALFEGAKAAGVQLVLYGHTHIPKIEYTNGIYLVNPGPLCGSPNPASYATVDLEKGGIFPNIIRL